MTSKYTMKRLNLGAVGRELVFLPLYASEEQVAQLVLGTGNGDRCSTTPPQAGAHRTSASRALRDR